MVIAGQTLAAYLSGKRFRRLKEAGNKLWLQTLEISQEINSIGITKRMEEYEKRKLRIFNRLVFFQLIAGCIFSLPWLVENRLLPFVPFEVTLPVLIGIGVLLLNAFRRYETAMIVYFLLYPIATSVIYMRGIDMGLELNFILYGILSVFFLKNIGWMVFSVTLSMVSYFVLSVLLKNYQFQLADMNFGLYLFNHLLATLFIFYGLFLIKRENTGYQVRILEKSRVLHKKNLEILRQKKEIQQKAELLEKQTAELKELNGIKDKLFSVIAHDLKTPMYALRNLFRYIDEHNLPPREIKSMIPDVMHDLNYTTELMDNLLVWAKSQMQVDNLKPKLLAIGEMTDKALQLLRLQAKAKKIYIQNKVGTEVYALGDRDMISLVLRNLLSNAIKFTPHEGQVTVGSREMPSHVEVFVQDTGTGMTPETLQRIFANEYYSTKGTSNESGTGLGLMLCREFLDRNGGRINIESSVGNGSTFTFTLPKAI
jgi:two-component system, sensor histidine kinase and response regulator